jgi:hypothetical protein
VKPTYDETNCVGTKLGRSAWFKTSSGLTHRIILSPILFHAVMDETDKSNNQV